MKNKKGFTLIELLAVIVILAILMVIAIPKILNVIDSSRNSAAESSLKLVRKGIKTNVASAELLPTNPYTKSEGCYVFDFDNNNTNVQSLAIDNKDKVGGSIKLCNGVLSDDTLTFDGSTGSSGSTTTTTTTNVEMIDSNFTYNTTYTGGGCWLEGRTGYIFTATSWSNAASATYYNEKITVGNNETYKIKTKVGLDHNYTDGVDMADFYVGLATTTGVTTDDYVDYEMYDITKHTAEGSNNAADEEVHEDEFTISTPGEYYVKIYVKHTPSVGAYTAYANWRELTIEKTTIN